MNDDKQPNPDPTTPPPRTPNRDYRRAPPVIEGEVSPASASEPATEPTKAEALSTAPADETISTAPVDDAAGNARAVDPPAAEPPPDPPPVAQETPETPPARGYGLGAVAAASLASAALAAVAVYGLQNLNTPSGPSPAALETRLNEIEKRAAAAPQVSPATLAALEKRIAGVEATASGAAETARKAVEAAARPAPAAAPAVSPQALTALETRLATIEKNAMGTGSDLGARLAEVEKALAAPKSEERATETRVEPAAPPPDIEPLRKQLARLESRLQTLEGQMRPLADAARAAEGRFKGLEERIQPLAGRIDESRAQDEAERKRTEAIAARSADAARIALAQSLAAAVASGAPFAAQVEALTRLGVPAERLSPLRETAKSGVATNAELARSLAALEPKIVARPQAPADASVIDRLTSSALGLVRVRPTGEATGDAPADVFARMTQALRNGDVAGALKDWEKLPESARTASAEWANRAKARLAAEAAARAILADQAQTIGRT